MALVMIVNCVIVVWQYRDDVSTWWQKIESTFMCTKMQGGMIKWTINVKIPIAICIICMMKLHMLWSWWNYVMIP